jgi:hypothetical protein
MKQISVKDVTESAELLRRAQNYQEQIDLISIKITNILGGSKDDIIHEIVDQAVLNNDPIEWVIEEYIQWEEYFIKNKAMKN